jgi:hypothetical protein
MAYTDDLNRRWYLAAPGNIIDRESLARAAHGGACTVSSKNVRAKRLRWCHALAFVARPVFKVT